MRKIMVSLLLCSLLVAMPAAAFVEMSGSFKDFDSFKIKVAGQCYFQENKGTICPQITVIQNFNLGAFPRRVKNVQYKRVSGHRSDFRWSGDMPKFVESSKPAPLSLSGIVHVIFPRRHRKIELRNLYVSY